MYHDPFLPAKKSTTETTSDKVESLYLHIPFCRQLCHYCDFAKTANYTDQHLRDYITKLCGHLEIWWTHLQENSWLAPTLSTVYIGGGTPGIYGHELSLLLETIRPWIGDQTEITLETNPNLCDQSRLAAWQKLGINRLSIGIQTFAPEGLTFLTRDHSADEAKASITRAASYIPNINADLIYGWPQQTLGHWQEDLSLLRELPVVHTSCYSLTYASGTPIGRSQQRGKITAATDDQVAQFYDVACEHFHHMGWNHYEISNWSKNPQAESRHNIHYWQGAYYLGVGTGAHGYLPAKNSPWGRRYAYAPQDRLILHGCGQTIDSWEKERILSWEEQRTDETYLVEAVGSALRWRGGLDCLALAKLTDYRFEPSSLIQQGQAQGLLEFDGAVVRLTESQWFLETYWASKILACFTKRPAASHPC
jgi:oxygen-independent coproporphyrinogen-3 oxidase